MKINKNHSIGELLACVIARELKNDDTVAFGLHAEFTLAAAFLAQKLYSPKLKIRHGLSVNNVVELNPAAWTSNVDSKSHLLVQYNEKHDSILSIANPNEQNKLCDTFFVSGLQIDKSGNTNLIGTKDENRKFKFRGPGSIGTTSIAQLSKKYFIFSLEHSKRRFVEEVYYISSIGYNTRKKYGIAGGPLLCITPLCVFDFENGIMRIKSIHSSSNLQEVLDKTGFQPIVPKNIEITKEPSKDELKILRQIDKEGFLINMDSEIVA
ncbi:MAG TPA: CoA-transferase [Candidatus Nanoarchaeia archaeon]|nr:CoA-transferase [Candidatus Nanoarchaeia archaeon]